MIHHKIYFRKSYKNSSGEHPIYLRINQKKKVSDISLNVFSKEKCWNEEKLRVTKKDSWHDKKNKKLLNEKKWKVIVVWECETKDIIKLKYQIQNEFLKNK